MREEDETAVTDVKASIIFHDGFSRHFDVELFDEAANGESAVTAKPVRELLARLAQLGALAARLRREAGRALAVGPYADAEDRLDAFAAMGLGQLRLRATEREQRTFTGEALLDITLPGATTCEVALGFCEGVVAAQTGEKVLGAETACQRKGAAHCVFLVRTRAA